MYVCKQSEEEEEQRKELMKEEETQVRMKMEGGGAEMITEGTERGKGNLMIVKGESREVFEKEF